MNARDPWAPSAPSDLSGISAWTDDSSVKKDSNMPPTDQNDTAPSNRDMDDTDDPMDAQDAPATIESLAAEVRRLQREARDRDELGPGEHNVDPYQIVIPAKIKKNRHCDTISFALHLAIFKLVFIVNIPDDENVFETKVYCKFRLNKRDDFIPRAGYIARD